ncbi:efflux RND transporter periplasmic adaptor subunit [Pontibacterium granulatum]|uniref:efflux RND transporter periplasmic adaptor subunit n=1 Tax=Pontibacterium granulatum TaxID=2036029 RepID=UPI00249C1987|nr:efflux RND transporter periplasmic adaptor subunit [Pontibacterium granulatum]MDI3326194.1 efflux RND transporter periplasmic adaptor subunit [Pontibacterium granulatum]
MSNTIKNIGLIVMGAAIGAGAVVGGYSYIASTDTGSGPVAEEVAAKSNEPLYWVAPMDPNYRRDKPGKSPMGMDLIPVYEESGSDTDAGPGTIKVSAEVVNNLGVRTAQSALSKMHFEVRTVGYVDYNQDKIVHVHPRVDGWIEKVYIKAEGEPVEQGQPLYDLYSPALVNAQEEYLFALARGNKKLIKAAESRLLALQVPQQTIRKLRKTRQASQTVTFYAPQSGVVDNFRIREGFFVKPGNTLMSIGALDEVWVEAEVFERQANMIRAGLPVSIQLDYLPGKAREGVVDYVYPVLDPVTRTLKVRMRFSNHDLQLKPNMFAKVVIHKHDEEESLTVPQEAVIRGAKTNRLVLALGDGRYKSIEVKIGRSDGSRIEILEGLSAGEEVVTSAQFLLDSESSKTSDFKRMHIDESMDSEEMSLEGMSLDSMHDDEDMSLDGMSLDGSHDEMDSGEMNHKSESQEKNDQGNVADESTNLHAMNSDSFKPALHTQMEITSLLTRTPVKEVL